MAIRTYGTLWRRLVRGVHWTWLAEDRREVLPADLESRVMSIESQDRLHAKQGRSTARVIFHAPAGRLSVYLKRHYRLSWTSGLGALLAPGRAHTPASAEWSHIQRVRELGIDVPEVVAVGERIGPWGALSSFLMVTELEGRLALNEALPTITETVPQETFRAWKRSLIDQMAQMVATLHQARVFHKDLYLCHFFIDPAEADHVPDRRGPWPTRPVLIDLHRTQEHAWFPDRWRWKDLGQLLFSTRGVPGITPRDISRFWVQYQRQVKLRKPKWQAKMVEMKAQRYFDHNNS